LFIAGSEQPGHEHRRAGAAAPAGRCQLQHRQRGVAAAEHEHLVPVTVTLSPVDAGDRTADPEAIGEEEDLIPGLDTWADWRPDLGCSFGD
jgi:hypothetical protein